MFVGHALVAFALAATLAGRRLPRRKAVAFGVVAGLFAAVPDADMAYALVGLGDALGSGTVREGFWSASTVTHRGATHSLLVALPAAAAFALGGRRGLAGAGALSLACGVIGGPVTGGVVALFAAAGLLVGRLGRETLPRRQVFGAALLGLLSHPFGDLLTGDPPAFLWPVEFTVLTGRLTPFADPTLNLLLAFFVELGAIWLGVLALAALRDADVRRHLHGKAALGAAYAGAVLFVPSPTVHTSYSFVFSVLAVGFVGAVPARLRRPRLPEAVVTGLAAVTLAAVAYGAAYLLL